MEVVPNDAALRIKAAHVELAAKEYVPVPAYGREGEGPGWVTVEGLDGALIDRVFEERRLALSELGLPVVVHENEFAVLRAGKQSALTRPKGGHLCLLRQNQEAFDLKPRNVEERMALDLLLDPSVSVVALDGPAGTGRPCWPSPPASSRCGTTRPTAATSAWRSTARSWPSGARRSATCPGRSRRRSTRGWAPSTTPWWP